ncbi:MAG: polysaccharide lyase beta-sandwich domain-containing protein [Prevotella sp.]|nr:polysaccharide lyase beta-sandwich domain-containing protein [Prevotella sp.]
MQQVKKKILELHEKSSDEVVRKYFDSQKPDGSWDDVNYQDTMRSQWSPSTHAGKLSAMATAYKNKGSAFYNRKNLAKKIHLGMKYWHEGNFVSPNWWHNQIGVPKILGILYLLMEDEMSKSEMDAAIKYMENAQLGMTGQNSVWLAENVLVRSILLKDEHLFFQARDHILKELVVSKDGEGVRPDMSFHQHGPQQQFGNYGLSYANTQAYWARIFKGTAYELTKEQLDVIHNYLVGGLQWTCWKRFMDIGSCGRQVVPNAQKSKARSYGKALVNAMIAYPEKANEYKHIFERDIEASINRNDLTGYRFFHYSDYGLYRTDTWSAGLKMSSCRTIGAEIINYENLLGRFLCNGGMFFYRNGNEYEDIFPVWDWTLVPGTTCFRTDLLFPGVVMGKYYRNDHDFAGGLSGNRYGVSAIIVNDAGLYAKKSYFFTDQAVVCLGSDIHGDNNYEITTSIDQKLQKGDIAVLQKPEGQIVYHDKMAYYVLDNPTLNIKSGKSTGNWQRIASVNSPALVETNVFGLWISHGIDVKNASYGYMVFPDIDSVNLLNNIEKTGVNILCKDEKVHAISYENLLQAVFFEPASVRSLENETFSALTPCIIMIEVEGNKRTLSVCDPTQKENSIALKLSGEWSGKYCTYDEAEMQTVITVPVENSKGATIHCILTRKE